MFYVKKVTIEVERSITYLRMITSQGLSETKWVVPWAEKQLFTTHDDALAWSSLLRSNLEDNEIITIEELSPIER